MTQSEWLEIIRAGAPVLAALLAGGVAWKFGSIQAGISRQQAATAVNAAQTAKNKLKLDLFEKRLAIYNVASRAISTGTISLGFSVKEYRSYCSTIQGARWLFGDEVYEYLDTELGTKLKKLSELGVKLNHATQERRPDLAMEALGCAMQLSSEIARLNETFKKYLRIED